MSLENYLDFLREERVEAKQQELLNKKIRNISKTKIGNEIGVSESSRLKDIPFTSYKLYQKYIEKPAPEAFMYPLDQYVRVMTSGSKGIPKWYLIPRQWIAEDMGTTWLSILAAATHDGKKPTIQKGDTIYANLAPPPFYTGFGWNFFRKICADIFNSVPEDQGMPFPEKINYFVNNYEKIHVAVMPFSILMSTVYPRIGKPFKLKGYLTVAEMPIYFYKEKITGMIGTLPSTLYAATETGMCSIPSVQHFLGIIFDWRRIYCEFMPEDWNLEESVSNVESIPIDEVRVGERYQLVATPFGNDILRYAMTDLFECIGRGDDILGTSLPVFRILGRVGSVISLHNFTRIDEKEIFDALRSVEVAFNDFTARVEAEEARECLVIYLEPKEAIKKDEVEKALHEQLLKMDRDYSNLSEFYRYTPLRLKLLLEGTFATYLEQRTGFIKPERIGMKKENFDKLIAIADRLRSERK